MGMRSTNAATEVGGDGTSGLTSSSTGTNHTINWDYTADGVSGFYAWGHQFEALSFASSYIPTTSASVTRSADIVKAALLNNEPLREMSFSVTLPKLRATTGNRGLWQITTSVGNIKVWFAGSTMYFSWYGATAAFPQYTFVDDVDVRMSFVVESTDRVIYANGAEVARLAINTEPTLDLTGDIYFGQEAGGYQYNQHIKNLEIHDFAFNPAEALHRGTI